VDQKRAMIVFNVGSWRFTYGVGAIIILAGYVALMSGDTAALALERELTEELGARDKFAYEVHWQRN
jgi:hypothetical protein